MAIERYDEYLAQRGFVFVERGVWVVVGAAVGSYGWKLHLSSTQRQVVPLLSAVLPILRAHGVAFKIARDATVLGFLNEGALGATQVGKFATIYPPGIAQARSLAAALVRETRDLLGPVIDTDRHLGGVVYARYGPFSPNMTINRLGLTEPEATEDAALAEYAMPFALPDGVADPFDEMAGEAKPACAGGVASVRPIGPGYLLTRVIASHAKGAVYEALDLRDREGIRTVVLKEGRLHRMSDGEGRAMQDRIANQAAAHRRAADTGAVPAAEAPFRFGQSLFLPLEMVSGHDLAARPATPYSRLTAGQQEELIGTLRKTAGALRRLHRAGVIHRDLSMRNIRVTPAGEVRLLDLEIAHVIASDAPAAAPFMQGTPGFVSPQQLAGEPPAFADDVFSLGAVFVCILTGLDPQRVLFAHEGLDVAARAGQLQILSGAPAGLCRLAAECVDPDRAGRPGCDRIIARIASSPGEAGSASDAWQPDGAQLTELVRAGARWLIEGALRDQQSGQWRSPDIEMTAHADIRLVHSFKLYRSANVGVAGVVYILAKLVRHGFPADHAAVGTAVGAAVDWLLAHQPTTDDQLPGLHFGETGVALAIAEALASGLIERGGWTTPYFREVLSCRPDWPDLTHGAAGQGLGALACALLLDDPAVDHAARLQVEACAGRLCETQNADGSWTLPEGVTAMSGQAFTGLAHGAAGPLAFLAQPQVRAWAPGAVEAADRAARWLLGEARAGDGGTHLWWPMAPGTEEKAWTWWCHGAPGIAVALLHAHRATGEPRLAGAARAALRSHPFAARSPNLGQCHGLSGIGEIYLDAYELLQEQEWIDRAWAIGRVLAMLARRDAQGASWLVENPYVPTPDLMIGTGGVVHFLARLARLDRPFAAPLWPVGRLDGRTA